MLVNVKENCYYIKRVKENVLKRKKCLLTSIKCCYIFLKM
jgi:hypothetical protein